jgi:hypothetical protein
MLLASTSYCGSMSPATASHARGIHMIEKPLCIRRKPKFLCRLCKGDHLTHLCHATIVVQAWYFPGGPLCYESSLVSQPYLVDTTVMPMQYLADTTLLLGSDASPKLVILHLVQPVVMLMQSLADTTPVLGIDASLDLVVSHSIQPMVEEVVVPMQSSVNPTLLLKSNKSKEVTLSMQFLVNPTLLLRGDAYFDHVLSISSYVPSTQERILLSRSILPLSLRVVSSYWNDLVEPLLLSSTPFQITRILLYIVDKVTSSSILSSSTWKALGFPKIVSTICELLTFDRSPT